jgi:hypothetical protein
MSPQAKKSTWLSVILSGTIVAALGVAYSAGMYNSNVRGEISRVDERVEDNEEDMKEVASDLDRHIVKQTEDMEKMDGHLHRIDIRLTEQTQILKRMERND